MSVIEGFHCIYVLKNWTVGRAENEALGESLHNCSPPLIQHEDGGGDSSSDMEDEYCPSSGEDEGPEESDSDEDYTSLSEGGSESGS